MEYTRVYNEFDRFLLDFRCIRRPELVSEHILCRVPRDSDPNVTNYQAQVPGAFLSICQLRVARIDMYMPVLLLERSSVNKR